MLVSELRKKIEGEVRFSDEERALYATDASNYRKVPLGAALPKSPRDVEVIFEWCRQNKVSIVSRGAGTSLAGQTMGHGLVLDFSRHLNQILDLDPHRRRARVEPGCILDNLRQQAELHGLTFGPDPATHSHNTLGGMIGNNSCGVHSVMAGRTADNVERLRIITYRGLVLDVGPTDEATLRTILEKGGPTADIYRKLDSFRKKYGALIRERFPALPRRVSGYADLDKLLPENGFDIAKALVGTEGTCVTILDASLRLVPSPSQRALVIIGFRSIEEAADAAPRVLRHGPIALEGFDSFLVDAMKRKNLLVDKLGVLPEGENWLIAEFGADTKEDVVAKADDLTREFDARQTVHARRVIDPDEESKVWIVREAGLPASAYVPDRDDAWEGWEDSAVPPERLGAYVRDLRALMSKHGYVSPFYGHFGDGLVHCRINFDFRSESGIENWRKFTEEAADLVVRYGGSLSGEHGDGQARADLLVHMYGPELIEAFREFKAIWDPDGMMNPGKIVNPYPMTENLRLGPDYKPPRVETTFAFRDEGGFQAAAERCVGVGKCRRNDPGAQIMCPSYIVTREEKHSTRGRARLLFEMLRGEALRHGWRTDAVEDALSLCLACKGCKSDCPVNVDMATYKAEFRSHYYKGRLRPRTAYSMGLIHWWSRIASVAPAAANFAVRSRFIGPMLKGLGGVADERNLPTFADETFMKRFRKQSARSVGQRGKVVLWADTFNNHFRPETAMAAAASLEAAGYNVTVPNQRLCCGRPLYDWGMLKLAKRQWRHTMRALSSEISEGTPVIILEPACASAFKDELLNLFPDDPVAQKLSSHAYYFSDFLAEEWDGACSGAGSCSGLVHIHCHHHAVLGRAGESKLLNKLGVDHRIVPSGCCGMAGSFGYAKESAQLSFELGERSLLPAVRQSDDDMIIASGFSCREQIEQRSGRKTLHAAEVMAQRLRAS